MRYRAVPQLYGFSALLLLSRALFAAGLAAVVGLQAQTNLFPEFHLETARDYLQALSQTVPFHAGTNAEACFIHARLESQLGDKAQAERLAREALAFDPNRADIQVFIADMLIRQDRLEEAAQCLRLALEADPRVDGGYRRLGMILDRQGKQTAAKEAFANAIRLHPDDAAARLLMGKFLLDRGEVETACTELERACQLDPTLGNAHYALFQAQTRLGQAEAAQKTLRTFKSLKKEERSAMEEEDARYKNDPAMRAFTAGAHVEVGSLLLAQGRDALAEAHLRQAIAIAPQEPKAYELLGDLCLRKARFADAKPLLAQLVRLRPNDVGQGLNYGTVLLQLKDYPAAENQLKRVLQLDSKQPQTLYNLSRFYLSTRQQLPEALALCRRLLCVQSNAAAYDLLGWALYANGRTNDALTAAAQAVEKDPDNAVYRQRHERLQKLMDQQR